MCSRTRENNKNKVGTVLWDTLYLEILEPAPRLWTHQGGAWPRDGLGTGGGMQCRGALLKMVRCGGCNVVLSTSPHPACDLLHSSTDLAQLSIIICTNLHSLPQESCRQESSCGWCWPRPGWSAVWPPASTSSPSASPPSHSCWELSWWFYTKLTFDQISWLGLPGLSNSSQNSSIGNPYSKDFLHALNVKAEPRIPYSAVVII